MNSSNESISNSDWYYAIPAPSTSRLDKHGCPDCKAKHYRAGQKISLPLGPPTLTTNNGLMRSASCSAYNGRAGRGTWYKSCSHDSFCSRFNSYRYSISGVSLAHEPTTDSLRSLCCHLLKLVCLVSMFMVAVFFIQCLMYFLYTLVYHSMGTQTFATPPIPASANGQKSLRDVFGMINESRHLVDHSHPLD